MNKESKLDGFSSLDAEGNDIYKKAIKIDGIEGFYYVEDDQLIHSCDDEYVIGESDDVQVSDLTELTVWQYDRLVTELNEHYPNYPIKHLKGDFI